MNVSGQTQQEARNRLLRELEKSSSNCSHIARKLRKTRDVQLTVAGAKEALEQIKRTKVLLEDVIADLGYDPD